MPARRRACAFLNEPMLVNSLNFLKPWLVESPAPVIIPLDDGVLFVRLFNCTHFPGRYSEVAQTLDPISGTQFLACGRRLREQRPLGAVRIRSRPTVRQGWLGRLTQRGYWLLDSMGHSVFSSTWPEDCASARLDRSSVGSG